MLFDEFAQKIREDLDAPSPAGRVRGFFESISRKEVKRIRLDDETKSRLRLQPPGDWSLHTRAVYMHREAQSENGNPMMANVETSVCNTRRILVVDDEPIVLKSLSETLREEGCEVVTASNATEALNYVRQQQFAVVITDQRMPRMSGLELLERVRLLQPTASRILVTAVLNVDTLVEAINKGEIHRFISKPWLCEELMEAVGAAIKRYKMELEKAALESRLAVGNERLSKLNALLLKEAIAKDRELRRARQIGRNIQLAMIAVSTPSKKKASRKASRLSGRGSTQKGRGTR